MEILNPVYTYQALLIVQFLHLLHHRLVKRHISFAEVISGALLCLPPSFNVGVPAVLLSSLHILMMIVQIIGSIWIKKLSPNWESQSSS